MRTGAMSDPLDTQRLLEHDTDGTASETVIRLASLCDLLGPRQPQLRFRQAMTSSAERGMARSARPQTTVSGRLCHPLELVIIVAGKSSAEQGDVVSKGAVGTGICQTSRLTGIARRTRCDAAREGLVCAGRASNSITVSQVKISL